MLPNVSTCCSSTNNDRPPGHIGQPGRFRSRRDKVTHGRAAACCKIQAGCGKTTVARSIVGLTRPSSGQILLGGDALGRRRSRAQQRAVQMVFQDPYSSLNPRLTVRRVLTELLAVHGLATGPAAARRCAELVEQVGLPADALDRLPV
jgi:ABC-type dipeptide/oligopeptide/nickel transport system ATPase subunit